MAEVIFNYEGINTRVQCNINDKMKDIIDKFLIKIKKKDDHNELVYLYNGNQINNELIFNEQSNDLDKNRKKMNVLVTKNDNNNENLNEIISKNIICPIYKENILIDIKNFKINLSGCKSNHVHNNILLTLFKETQKIDLSNIICNI